MWFCNFQFCMLTLYTNDVVFRHNINCRRSRKTAKMKNGTKNRLQILLFLSLCTILLYCIIYQCSVQQFRAVNVFQKNLLSVSCHNQLRIDMRPLTAGCDDLRFCGESTWINSTRFSHHQCWRYLQKAATAWLMMQRAITRTTNCAVFWTPRMHENPETAPSTLPPWTTNAPTRSWQVPPQVLTSGREVFRGCFV